MKLKKQMKRSMVFILALIMAATSSLAVYAAVSYDSSKDPVVSLSGMVSYVESALKDIKSALTSLENRVKLIELGGTGGGGGGSVGAEQLADAYARLDALEKAMKELERKNSALEQDLKDAQNEYRSLIAEITEQYNTLSTAVSSIGTDIVNLQNQITLNKNDLLTLEKDFKQIADISTKLETVSHKLNQLTSSSGDISKLKKQVTELKEKLDDVLGELGQIYKPVFVPYGSTVIATGEDDTVVLILRSGSALAVSPFTEAGTIQGLNNLTLGTDIYNGENVPLFHHIMIPRGGSDGRGVTVTSMEGAYFLLGGDYTIVAP